MTLVFAILSFTALFLSFLFAPASFGAAAVTLAVLAHMAQARENHAELLEALGHERPTRKQEFEAAREEMAE